MNRSFFRSPARLVALILLALTLLCCASIPLAGLAATLLGYEGKCYGFTDGVWDCSWTKYALDQTFYAIMLATLPLFLLGFAWGALAGWWLMGRWLARRLPNLLVTEEPGWLKPLLRIVAGLVLGLAGGIGFLALVNALFRLAAGGR